MPNHSWLRSLRSSTALAALAAFGGLLPAASANLLINPASGIISLSGVSTDFGGDDRTVNGMFPVSPDYFGNFMTHPFATISVNGSLTFGSGDGNDDYFILPLGGNYVNRVAPLWGDFKLGTSGRIIEHVGSDYYAVTWLGLEGENKSGDPDKDISGTAEVQVIFIETDTSINGNDFLTGDIIFSYGEMSLYSAMPELIIGLEDANGNYAALPGHEPYQGWHSYDVFGPFQVGSDQYVLFRQNGLGGYDVSIETLNAIPEPAAYAAVLAFAGLGIAYRSRRSRKA